jgi:hypothetical protein
LQRCAHGSSFCRARDEEVILTFFRFICFRLAIRLQLAWVFDKGKITMTQSLALTIVWRNPKPLQRRQRWEQIKQNSKTARYVIQELVSTSAGSFWTATSSFEIVQGGRAA